MLVLIVEDQARTARELRAGLEASGVEARVAPSGEEALRLLDSAGFDALGVDVMLPGRSGIGLVRSLLGGFALGTTVLVAQTTASLRIEVLDPAGRPSPGAALTLESVERGESRLLRADARGIASIAGLLPGAYRLQGQTLKLRADERVHLRLRLEPAQATVSVEASPLRVETSSVSAQTSFSAEELARLPFSPQRYVEHGYLAPGVTPSGKPEPVVLGSMLDANAFLVDGMETRLSSTGRFGMNLSTEILDSQTLTTGGHKAEVGFASGGVYNLVTKSGGSEFHGSIFTRRIFRGLNAKTDEGKASTPEERPTDANEVGFSLGGPLIKDTLFFFGAFNRQLLSLDFENVRPVGSAPHRRSQEEDRSYRFLKLTWLAGADHRFEFSYFGDPVTQTNFDTAGDSSVKDFQQPVRTRGGDSYLLKHVGALGTRLTWENTLGLHRTSFHWTPATPGAGSFRGQLDAPGGESFGAYAEDRLDRIRNLTLRSEFSWSGGSHQIKGGFQGLAAEYTKVFQRPSFGLAYLDRAAGGAGPAAGDLAAIQAGLQAFNGNGYGYASGDSLATPSPVSGQLVGGRASYLYQRTLADATGYGRPLKQRVAGLFLQDDWSLGPRWTVNAGLRLDRAGLDAEDGRSLYRQTLLSPRLGLSWDPAADGRIRLFAYSGRIYSPPTPGNLTTAGATTGGPSLVRQVWIPTQNDWRTWQASGVQGAANMAVGDLRAPRTDLHQLGAQRVQDLPWVGAWTLEATLTLKRVRDLIDTYSSTYGYLPELDALANSSSTRKVVANLPGLKRDFRGLDLVARRDFEAGHRLQLSYSQGDLNGNTEVGNVNTATGKSTGFASIPSLRQDYRQPQYDGNLNEEVKHAWKAFGSAALPWNLESSFAFLWRSGLRYSSLVRVSGDNVLAPATTRGDQELPQTLSLDLGLAWRVRLRKVDLRAAVDVFNATNRQPMIWVNNVGGAFTPGNFQQPRVWQFSLRASF
ncbi:MAG: TonB-dependent receptor [Holophagaceae bacterium]|uniref:TonB-dependent receptor n=1 Tax=Candidatus Geothrix skivensis TaxID=2954439 RepID=A0A9D7SGZ6_9BACT|nr:TonB-dependent receptor [Candidatus Geothrix skivensis]